LQESGPGSSSASNPWSRAAEKPGFFCPVSAAEKSALHIEIGVKGFIKWMESSYNDGNKRRGLQCLVASVRKVLYSLLN
jgi:hypothetical protein